MITLSQDTANVVRAALCFTADNYRSMVVRSNKIRDEQVMDIAQNREDDCIKAVAMLPRIDNTGAEIVGKSMRAYIRELGRTAALASARGNTEGANIGEVRQRAAYAAIAEIEAGGVTNAC